MAAVDSIGTYSPVAGPERHGGYLTVRETAEVLHMHFMSVYKMVQTGRLPAVKVGSRWKIDPEALRVWMSRQNPVQRNWLLVGARESTVISLQAMLGNGHRVTPIGFESLRAALDDEPDAVLIDSTGDANAALAALAVCREALAGPLLGLCVGQPTGDLLRAALAGGVVTLLGLPVTARHIEQLTTMLQGA